MRELTEQEIVRREKLQNIKNPYPERYEITHEICDAANLEDGVTLHGFKDKEYINDLFLKFKGLLRFSF